MAKRSIYFFLAMMDASASASDTDAPPIMTAAEYSERVAAWMAQAYNCQMIAMSKETLAFPIMC